MKRTVLGAAASAALLLALGTGSGTASAAPAKYEPCTNGVNHKEIKTSWTGFATTLTKGGPVTESTVVYTNDSGQTIKDFDTALVIGAQNGKYPAGSFTVQLKVDGGDWKPVDFGAPGGYFEHEIRTGKYELAKDQTVTLKFRVSATDKANAAEYSATASGGSAIWDDDLGRWTTDPAPAPLPEVASNGRRGTCTQFTGAGNVMFNVATPASPSASPSTPAPTASTPAATPSVSASPSAPPKTGLAETGAGPAVPFAVAGALALAGGAGILVALRRRKATRG